MNLNPQCWAVIAAIVLGGCAVGPDYRRPDIPIPDQHRMQETLATAEKPLAEQSWREVFKDSALQSLIQEALQAGPEALLAVARIDETRALAGIARAPLLPQVSASLNTSPIARMEGDTLSSSFLGGLGISWEIDLWGRYRRASEAARAEFLASIEARHALHSSLVANVARQYYQLAWLHETLEITEHSADNQRAILQLVRRLSSSGISSAAEERQQEVALATTESGIPSLRRQIGETEHALSLLLGRPPGPIAFNAGHPLVLPEHIPAGLPAQLLERRPDIRQAEAALIAANARIGEAKAQLFPSLSLTAMFGGVSTRLSEVIDGRAATVASLGPNVFLPFFSGGRLYFNREAAQARMEQAGQNYRKAILNALGEVANALNAYATSQELMSIQARRLEAAREAMRLADLRFRAGTANFLEVLDAQRQLLAAETQRSQALFERRAALISIYLALGGGWEAQD